MKMTAVRGFQPTGNKNKPSKTTDSETPLKSDKLARAAGGRAHLGSVLPGHALHENGLQGQIGVGTLVNSQQLRALAVPVMNR